MLVNGQRVSGSGPTQAKAKKSAKERAKLAAKHQTRGTFKELFEEWETLPKDIILIGPSTRDTYRFLIRKHFLPTLGDEMLTKMTEAKVAKALGSLNSLSTSTRRNAYAGLVKVLDYAVSQKRVGTNVARLCNRPVGVSTAGREITQDQVLRILKAARGDRYEVAAWLGFGCGLRRGEILALRWVDVDFERGELAVDAHVGNLTRTSAGLIAGPPKTERGARRVPIPAEVVTRLRAHRRRQLEEQLKAGDAWRYVGTVLTNEIGGYVEPRSLSRSWNKWAKSANVNERGTHAGRHYAASTLLASGRASAADVAAQLGHNPAVLLTTYAAAVAPSQRAAADVLGASLAKVSKTKSSANSRTNLRTNARQKSRSSDVQ
jgi:integrase